MLRSLYNWVRRSASGPRGLWVLGTVSFAEASFFPIPPDPALIPMILARPDRAYLLAGWCTLTSVLGGLLGYTIGYFLFAEYGHNLLQFYGLEQDFAAFQERFRIYGPWLILAKGVTPIPFKLVTIASGVLQLKLPVFVAACIATRSARFFATAWLLRKHGRTVDGLIERHLTAVTIATILLIIGGFAMIRLVGRVG